jgi:arylsulfatase A-like enzyme
VIDLRFRALAAAALGTLLVGVAWGADRRSAVILVLLDAARADRFSTYGYARETTPNVDKLAARGAVFLRHHTQGPNTLTSLPALLTSRYFAAPLFPHTASVPVARPGDLFRRPDGESISLPRAFAGAGYRTVAVSGHTWTRAGTAFAAEFDELRDVPTLVPYDHRRGYPTAAQVVDQAIDWIAAHRTAPFFMYLHLMDTLFPHPFEEDAQALFGAAAYDARAFDERGRPRASSQPLTGDDRRYLDALYDGGLRFADRHLGRLVAFLADAGLLDAAVVAVTSDHGEELLEAPGRIGHAGDRLYEALLHIPLVVFAPRAVPATRVDAFSEAVDVMPTLLDAAGVALPAGRRTDGRSLLPVARGAEPGATFTFSALHVAWANQRMLFPDPRPLLADQEELAAVELYDLAADPLELRNVAAERRDAVGRLAAEYRRRLGAAWRRAEAAVQPGPIAFPFAIWAADVDTRSTLPTLPLEWTPRPAADTPAWRGWSRSRRLWRHALVGRPGAEPLRIELPVPDGEYEVSVALRGAARVEPMGGRPHTVRGRPVVPDDFWNAEAVPLGRVEVRGGRFRARIVPSEAGAWLVVTHVAFRSPAAQPVADPAALERLRALGYVPE